MLHRAKGQMYEWCTHTKSYLRGSCPHGCTYCYVAAMSRRYPALRARYRGPVELDEKELAEPLGSSRIIFIEHLSDLWAKPVPNDFILSVLNRCREFPNNTYVFQTKNPERYLGWRFLIPPGSILGATIETDEYIPAIMGNSPAPIDRVAAMAKLETRWKRFITVEPILDFNVDRLVSWILTIDPNFVNIGADSKKSNLPEPPAWKIRELIGRLEGTGIEVRQKSNLKRIIG